MTGYSTREVSEVLGLPTSTILSWTRSGLLHPTRGPRGAYFFSFQDIALLKSARDLLDAEVPARRVRETLEALRDQLPPTRPLSAVRLDTLGGRVMVRDANRVWDPESGQLLMELDAQPDGPTPNVRESEKIGPAHPLLTDDAWTADDWYDAAVDLEPSAPQRSREAYAQALALDPEHVEAHVNLGRLLHEAGDVPGAEAHYRAALNRDAKNARANYNLGVALEDLRRDAEAIDAYEAALRSDPDLAVAHFNLSRLCEAGGRMADALGHLASYKRLLDSGDATV